LPGVQSTSTSCFHPLLPNEMGGTFFPFLNAEACGHQVTLLSCAPLAAPESFF